jgi:hypothetical protein
MILRFFKEYFFKIAVTVGVTSTVTVFALINKYWTWPDAVVAAVLLLSGLLYLTDRLDIGPSTRSRLRDWLDSSGYNIQTVQDANEFHFRMTDKVGITTDIIQNKADGPILVASGKHLATPQQLAAFNAMTYSAKAAFWRHVRLELLRYGVAFTDLKLDGEGVAFSDNVVLTRTFSAPELWRRLCFVRAGARLYQELLQGLVDSSQSSFGTRTQHNSLYIG